MSYGDLVQETITSAPGTGALTLTGANVTGYVTFAASFNDGTCVTYKIDDHAGNWEIGSGVLSSTGTNLTRDRVIHSSTGNALVNFSTSVTRYISVVLAANQIINLGRSYALSLGIVGL